MKVVGVLVALACTLVVALALDPPVQCIDTAFSSDAGVNLLSGPKRFTVKDHIDGALRNPLYCLRLDYFGGARYWTASCTEGSSQVVVDTAPDPSDNNKLSVRISGQILGGEDVGSTRSNPECYDVNFEMRLCTFSSRVVTCPIGSTALTNSYIKKCGSPLTSRTILDGFNGKYSYDFKFSYGHRREMNLPSGRGWIVSTGESVSGGIQYIDSPSRRPTKDWLFSLDGCAAPPNPAPPAPGPPADCVSDGIFRLDGDRVVTELDPTTLVVRSNFSVPWAPRNSALTGMATDGNRLYLHTADAPVIHVWNLATNTAEADIAIPSQGSCQALAYLNRSLYCTSVIPGSIRQSIVRIDLQTQQQLSAVPLQTTLISLGLTGCGSRGSVVAAVTTDSETLAYVEFDAKGVEKRRITESTGQNNANIPFGLACSGDVLVAATTSTYRRIDLVSGFINEVPAPVVTGALAGDDACAAGCDCSVKRTYVPWGAPVIVSDSDTSLPDCCKRKVCISFNNNE